MRGCDGFNPNQTSILISSTTANPSQLIKTQISPALSNKNIGSHKQKMTHLLGEWICSNIRPLSVVEDTGFKRIIEEAISIGYTCGPIKAESILSSRKTVSKLIKSNASSGREQIKSVLLKAVRERCLVLSPDIWSDAYRQQSYLGCTAHWTDDSWVLHSFEIFCIPFNTPNKKAPNVMKVLKEGLSIYDLVQYMKDIVWVSDRGSNIKKY
ncbi:unnamed protein product [Adineta ricciae]|uniref:Uncharacterized protein n=1 Tax=Adineta ricciae TaxID=249248 RepID=A0A816CBS0_ADIRI|nr:unnamed protein product [Adineta ricciae]CAF1620229.1 unnamed protein product [Adineta ricciae]